MRNTLEVASVVDIPRPPTPPLPMGIPAPPPGEARFGGIGEI